MILSHISLQNLFEKFPKFRKKIPYQKLFQAWRSTGPVDRILSRLGRSTDSVDRLGRPCLVSRACTFCARLSVDRPVGRLKAACSLFFAGRPRRSTDSSKCFSLWRPVNRPVDWVQRLVANRTAGRPVWSTDSRLQPPTTSFWFFGDLIGIWVSVFSETLRAILWTYYLVLIMFRPPPFPINRGDWSFAKTKKDT